MASRVGRNGKLRYSIAIKPRGSDHFPYCIGRNVLKWRRLQCPLFPLADLFAGCAHDWFLIALSKSRLDLVSAGDADVSAGGDGQGRDRHGLADGGDGLAWRYDAADPG